MKRIKERVSLLRPLLVPLILYIGLLALATNPQELTSVKTLQWAFVLLPMIPAAFLAIGTVKAIRKLDELEQKILLEAAAISFLLTFFVMIGLGFLSRVGVSTPNPIYISLFMMVVLLIGKLYGNRRHG
jgi:hypothetical protein